MGTVFPWMRGIALVVVVAGCALGAHAEDAPTAAPSVKAQVALEMAGRITAQGDVDLALTVEPPKEAWKTLKERYNSAAILFRDLVAARSTMETEFPTPVEFDDKALRIRARMILRGYAENRGDGVWRVDLDIGEGQKITSHDRGEQDGRVVLRWHFDQEDDDTNVRGVVALSLPLGATDVYVAEKRGIFAYELARSEGQGRPRVRATLRVKPRILTGAYKAYALKNLLPQQWLAKAVLKNTGPSVIRRLRVRFMIQGYSAWGLWSKFPEVVPGQTVVIPYHPVLDAKVAQLQSATPANVMVEYEYEDLAGTRHRDSDGVRATLLGGHEYFFTNYTIHERDFRNFYENFENSELLAAWVSREDPVVDEFSAMAHRLAGGGPSFNNAERALATLHAIYELWVRNKFVYVSPSATVDQSVSFDARLLQNLKFPRDVIRDRAGTCIELAILYCAMAHSQGLEPYLVLVPGHCYPAFLLPPAKGKKNRVMFAIEATGIQGGMGPGFRSWKTIVRIANEDLEKVLTQKKTGIVVPVRKLWERGITGPELPTLPADILQRWGMTEGSGAVLTNTDSREKRPAATPTAPTPSAPRAPVRQPTPKASPTLVGKWIGTQEYSTGSIVLRAAVVMEIQRAANGTLVFGGVSRIEQPNQYGTMIRLDGASRGVVTIRGRAVTFDIRESALKNVVTGQVERNLPSTLTLTLSGNVLSGASQSAGFFPVRTVLRRAP